MRKFRFNLETYLKVRQFEEKSRLMELSKVLSKVNQHQENSERYFSETDSLLKAEAARMREGNLAPEEVIVYRRYFAQLKRRKDHSDREVKKLQPEVEQARKKVRLAHIKVRQLEILKEKKYREYLKDYEKEAIQVLDEFNQRR